MKKILILIIFFIGNAYATRSRMTSLGQNADQGSFYFGDNRNNFRNPANVSVMRNYMVAELANGSASGVGNNLEGGYFGEFNPNLAYGVYLGKANIINDSVINMANKATTTVDFLNSQDSNPLNFFIGGGSDFKWGIDLNYSDSDKEGQNGIKQTYNSLGVSAGIETSGGLQVYLSYPIQNESKGSTSTAATTADANQANSNKIKTTGFTAGLIFDLGDLTKIWAQYSDLKSDLSGLFEVQMSDEDTELTTIQKDGELTNSQIIVGIGHLYQLGPTTRFNFDLSYNFSEVKVSEGGNGFIKSYNLPLNIGLETDAASWLIFRGSVKQNFIIGETKNNLGQKKSVPNDTIVAFGSSLNFGKLKIDGSLGGSVNSLGNNSALFDLSKFFVQAAATYMF